LRALQDVRLIDERDRSRVLSASVSSVARALALSLQRQAQIHIRVVEVFHALRASGEVVEKGV